MHATSSYAQDQPNDDRGHGQTNQLYMYVINLGALDHA
jgi:hypothetical protein